jgi:hypothetical protein
MTTIGVSLVSRIDWQISTQAAQHGAPLLGGAREELLELPLGQEDGAREAVVV